MRAPRRAFLPSLAFGSVVIGVYSACVRPTRGNEISEGGCGTLGFGKRVGLGCPPRIGWRYQGSYHHLERGDVVSPPPLSATRSRWPPPPGGLMELEPQVRHPCKAIASETLTEAKAFGGPRARVKHPLICGLCYMRRTYGRPTLGPGRKPPTLSVNCSTQLLS